MTNLVPWTSPLVSKAEGEALKIRLSYDVTRMQITILFLSKEFLHVSQFLILF